MYSTIVVEIRGGIAEVTSNPYNDDVLIVDWDTLDQLCAIPKCKSKAYTVNDKLQLVCLAHKDVRFKSTSGG